MSGWKFYAAALVCAASISAPAAAYTLHEGSGNFSDDWVSPTLVSSGATGVSGTGAPNWTGGDRNDIFQFSGLASGATSIVFDFTLTGPYDLGAYQNGGGSIYYSYEPFSGAYYVNQADGGVLGGPDLLAGNFDVTQNPWEAATPSNRGASSFTLNLMEDFAGELYLALDFTYGGEVSYNINTHAWAPPAGGPDNAAAVPLPATGWLLLGGLFGLAGLSATRRKLA